MRGLSLIVTDLHGFFSDEIHDARHQTTWLAEGVPGYRLTNHCLHGRYRIEKTVFAHPRRDAILQVTRFDCAGGRLDRYRLFALLDPHLGNRGGNNTAWVGRHKGLPILLAQRDCHCLALACSVPWLRSSAGFVGTASDGRHELARRGRLVRAYDRAERGNVGLTGEVDLTASGGEFVLALGFGSSPAEAAHCACASLLEDVEELKNEYINNWQEWQRTLTPVEVPGCDGRDLFRASTAVLRTHVDHTEPGAAVASLSIPWGQARTDAKTGLAGYHVVWPRDLAEIAGGLLAAGDRDGALRCLSYFRATQESDGHWPQNQWIDGAQEWTSIQMGESAMPILLFDLLKRHGATRRT